jgi:hypothetical protein
MEPRSRYGSAWNTWPQRAHAWLPRQAVRPKRSQRAALVKLSGTWLSRNHMPIKLIPPVAQLPANTAPVATLPAIESFFAVARRSLSSRP